MKRARIIYNPTSGREIFKKNLAQVLQKFEQAGYETSCHATTGEGDAVQAARNAAEREFDLIVAAGGDGTLNEVINGLAPLEHRPTLVLCLPPLKYPRAECRALSQSHSSFRPE